METKIVLITGAYGGIGEGLTRAFLKDKLPSFRFVHFQMLTELQGGIKCLNKLKMLGTKCRSVFLLKILIFCSSWMFCIIFNF